MGYLISGGPTQGLVSASLGQRLHGIPPCPESLLVIVAVKGDPNEVHPQLRSPAIHCAAWHGNARAVEILVGAGADLEAPDAEGGPPPLCSAIIAGNAKSALV